MLKKRKKSPGARWERFASNETRSVAASRERWLFSKMVSIWPRGESHGADESSRDQNRKKKNAIELVPPFRFERSDVSLDCGWTVLFLSPGRPWKMPAILIPSKPNRPRQISPLFSHTYVHPREVGKEERSQSLIFLTGTDQFLSLSLSLSFLSFKESKTREYSSSRFETTKFRE